MNGTCGNSYLRRSPRGDTAFSACRRALSLALFALAAAGIPLSPAGVQAQQGRPTEYQVKAAYLYNFGRFVAWPASRPAANTTFAICILGEDPFGGVLDATIAGERIEEKSVVARRIAKPQDARDCRVLFISTSENGHLKEILPLLEKAGVLTVSDIPRFTRRGGMIQFLLDGNRVRFEVNLAIAQSAGLSLSSELLKVAAAVRRDAGPGD